MLNITKIAQAAKLKEHLDSSMLARDEAKVEFDFQQEKVTTLTRKLEHIGVAVRRPDEPLPNPLDKDFVGKGIEMPKSLETKNA